RGNYYINEKLSDSYQIMYDVIASKVLEYKPTRVLEYGCGYGYLLKQIYLKNENVNCEYYGCDFSETQIENAKSYFPYGKFFIHDLTKKMKNIPDNFFDVVTGVGILLLLPSDKVNFALSELYRVMNKKILAAEYYYKYLPENKKKEYFDANDGRNVYDYEVLFKKVGLKNILISKFLSFYDENNQLIKEMPHTLISASKY
ncbi:class I SAM-dependent methyltransferase, partial [Candidatus Gracilibacteria bacterium]|nr:class I SAM-dependent methyltransferase [Candidatus Gracilibacteria bacterium]